MIITGRELMQGEMIPRFYGCAWRRWDHNAMVCYPVPLNIIFRWLRSFYFFLIKPAKEKVLIEAYRKGWESGSESLEERIYEAARRDLQIEYSDRFESLNEQIYELKKIHETRNSH